jgi:diguanylate cyclase (GGDEF)-like protein
MDMEYHRELRALIVDPDEENTSRTIALLKKARFFSSTIIRVDNFAKAMEVIQSKSIDVMLLNIENEESGGRPALSNGAVRLLDSPVIAMSKRDDEQLALEAVFGGAQDYLVTENLEPSTLDRAIRYAVERHYMLRELRELSLLDPLTGLYNRRAFFAFANQQMKLSERTGSRLLLFFADLDNLKWVNDNRGHLAGDRMLSEAADIFRATFRDSDLISRLGGDEFAIMAIEMNDSNAEALLERLRDRIEERNLDPKNLDGISMSVGVSLYDPKNPSTLEELLERADRLMYSEKRQKQKRQQ